MFINIGPVIPVSNVNPAVSLSNTVQLFITISVWFPSAPIPSYILLLLLQLAITTLLQGSPKIIPPDNVFFIIQLIILKLFTLCAIIPLFFITGLVKVPLGSLNVLNWKLVTVKFVIFVEDPMLLKQY